MVFDKNNLLRGASGKCGDMILYSHRNRMCGRICPAEVKAPSASGQLAQQRRMASIAVFYHALKEAGLYPCWKKAAEGMVQHGYNLLVKANLPAFGEDGRICDFPKLQIVAGELWMPDSPILREEEDGVWKLTWETERVCGLFQRPFEADDVLQLYLMKDCESFDVFPLEAGGCLRKEGQYVFRIPEKYKGFPHLYVFFCSRTDGRCSESRYFLIH